MIYVKAKIGEEIEIKVPLYGDQLFCHCPVCGIETQINEEILSFILEDGDLASSATLCETCTGINQNLNPTNVIRLLKL